MKVFSKKNFKIAFGKYLPLVLGLRIPGFIHIHFRYAKASFITWCVLFVAPFIFGVEVLSTFFERTAETQIRDWQVFLISLFVIALAFFFAERHRKFRVFYVAAIPAIIVLNGLFHLFIVDGWSIGSLVKFSLLAGFPAWWLGRHAAGKGYRLLSNGADKNYRPGRNLYMDGNYSEAFEHLEPSAKRGHMKSLYLIGHAHEFGHGRPLDRIIAARFYSKSARKGYGKAHKAFEALFQSFNDDEVDLYEDHVGKTGLSNLF